MFSRVGVLALLVLASCGVVDDADDGAEGGDDVLPGSAPVSVSSALGATQIVFVNFDGATIEDCVEPCSDAVANKSWAVGAHFGETAIDFLPYAGGLAGKNAILAKLRSAYARYDVQFVTARPANGDYSMIVVSATDGPNHGVAPLDCGNSNKRDIAFVYRTSETSADFSGRAAAHELGHTFGLAHVTSANDVMHWASRGSRITVSAYDPAHPSDKCFVGTTQNGPALLGAAVGLR